jgi:RNA recognition motif-containing protein
LILQEYCGKLELYELSLFFYSDQDGKYIPDRYNRAQLAQEPTPTRRRYSPPHQSHHGHHNNNNGRAFNLNQEDYQATRTLFVGNLPGDIRHGELMKAFNQYGSIEDIDLKFVNDGKAAYGFIVYMVGFE